ncbi:MAG TPA: hypothetical protein VNI01_07705, partial [Elusimicrobiota bacterium]|nr:hypothetical protein [Elusimicrobiota bacterium]
ESEGRKLAGGDSKGAEAVAAAIQPPPVGAAPYRAAAALLQSMRVSKANRSLNDLETLYRGFGFEWTDGTGHVKVNYRGYLRRPLTVPRHGEMKPYVVQAIKAIDELHVRLGLPLPDEDEAEPSIVVPLSRRTPPQRIPAGAINASLGD